MEFRHSSDTGISLDNILQDIKQGKIRPCYLIFGEEGYLVKEACDRIAAAIVPSLDNDFNYFIMDGENENLESLCTALMTPSLLAGRKVIVVRNTRIFHSRKTIPELIEQIRINLDQDPLKAIRDFAVFLDITGWQLDDLANKGWEKITDDQWLEAVGEMESAESRNAWLSKIVTFCTDNGTSITPQKDRTDMLDEVLSRGIPEGNHLIMTADAVDKRKKIYKLIAEKGQILQFSSVKGEARQRQVVMEAAQERLSASHKRMAAGAWTVLGRKTGFGLRECMEAVDKLISYTGDKPTIQEADVEEIIGKMKEDTVFDLTGTLVKKDVRAALMSLDELLDRGTNPVQILAMIAREIRLLLHGKIYLTSGTLSSFDTKMDYNRFQKSVYPHIKEMAAGKGKGGKHLAGMHPYVVYNTLKNAGFFSMDHLLRSLDELVSIDIALKSTAKDPRLMMERFIVNFCL